MEVQSLLFDERRPDQGGDLPPVASLTVCLLGLTFDSPNLGVQALLDGSLRGILRACPNAKISVLDYGYDSFTRDLRLEDRSVKVEFVNLRFSKKAYLPNNIAYLLVLSGLLRYLAPPRIRRYFIERNETLRRLEQIDVAASIAGGDSFSDIYGLGRLMYEALPQILVLMLGKKLILLPQTIGPFRGRLAQMISKFIMRRATVICSRDEAGMIDARRVLTGRGAEKVRFCYDVGFLVKPTKAEAVESMDLPAAKKDGECFVGFNVSGLLYSGGYTGKNMFGLKVGYRDLVERVISYLVQERGARVWLVPHVYGEPRTVSVESDQYACEQLYQSLPPEFRRRVSLVRGTYNANEIKHIIGGCDVFIGSRMHSCIAALSQGIPAVAISYSDKFVGVMETLGVSNLVADPRKMALPEIVDVISRTLEDRDALRRGLLVKVPEVQKDIVSTLGAMLCGAEGTRF